MIFNTGLNTLQYILEMDYTTLLSRRYASGVYVNHPTSSHGSSSVNIILNTVMNDVTSPHTSIVIPIHNQEEIIVHNTESILRCTTDSPYELILILDSCTDRTKEHLLAFFATFAHPPLLTNILMLESMTPLFETTADNIGFLCARGLFLLEIQADMEMVQPGYNTVLMKPFTQLPDLIGVSGRCCHGLTNAQGVGKLGHAIERPLSPTIDQTCFYIGETCNRGPLMLHAAKLRTLGFLDEKNYFLDNSDHDLFARAFAQRGWLCGYMPIEFKAPLSHGSTRKKRDEANERMYQYKRSTCTENGFLRKYLQSRPPSRPIRIVPLKIETSVAP